MKKIILTLTVVSALIFTSCSNSDEETILQVEAKTVTNLHAPQNSDYTVSPPVISGEYTKFSFKEGSIVTGNDWDIAFRGLKIIVNGGNKYNSSDNDEPSRTGNASLTVVNNTFNGVTEAPDNTEFNQDSENLYALNVDGDSWYTYNGQTHIVSANAGTIIVVKTSEGNYAKMEIVSYYKDGDNSLQENARYYTFNYAYNPNIGDKSFE